MDRTFTSAYKNSASLSFLGSPTGHEAFSESVMLATS